jgi:hypothetical protein
MFTCVPLHLGDILWGFGLWLGHSGSSLCLILLPPESAWGLHFQPESAGQNPGRDLYGTSAPGRWYDSPRILPWMFAQYKVEHGWVDLDHELYSIYLYMIQSYTRIWVIYNYIQLYVYIQYHYFGPHWVPKWVVKNVRSWLVMLLPVIRCSTRKRSGYWSFDV